MLLQAQGRMLAVRVSTPHGQTLKVKDIHSEATVQVLKERIRSRLGTAVEQQHLEIESGKCLEDGKALSHYNITEKDTLCLLQVQPGV